MELLGKYTVFAEGARGHLGKQLIAKYKLDAGRDPQSFAIGIKELWEVPPTRPSRAWWCTPPAGRWTSNTFGGGFLYHLEGNKVTLGLCSGWTTRTPG
jgi:electron-transferring-flavoprotein dehydrogenase